jgi:hypothetical protein
MLSWSNIYVVYNYLFYQSSYFCCLTDQITDHQNVNKMTENVNFIPVRMIAAPAGLGDSQQEYVGYFMLGQVRLG